MRKIISLVAGAALLAASSLGAAAPVQAAHHRHHSSWHWDNGKIAAAVSSWCDTHPWAHECHPHFRDKWGENDYKRWYWAHHGEHGFDPGVAALMGFAAVAGAAASAAAHNH